MAGILDNMSLPAPKWLRIAKKLISNTFNFAIAIMLLTGHADSSLVMLIVKLSQSFIMDQLDTFLADDEIYAKNTDYKLPGINTKE